MIPSIRRLVGESSPVKPKPSLNEFDDDAAVKSGKASVVVKAENWRLPRKRPNGVGHKELNNGVVWQVCSD
jgi:hypothetical protein